MYKAGRKRKVIEEQLPSYRKVSSHTSESGRLKNNFRKKKNRESTVNPP